jgi:hypothetical protein
MAMQPQDHVRKDSTDTQSANSLEISNKYCHLRFLPISSTVAIIVLAECRVDPQNVRSLGSKVETRAVAHRAKLCLYSRVLGIALNQRRGEAKC